MAVICSHTSRIHVTRVPVDDPVSTSTLTDNHHKSIHPSSMASHQVAIAKASLAAGLLRPDPTSVARDEITALHTSLDRALAHCSRANIQV